MSTYTKATPAVREYQKLQSLVNRRIAATDRSEEWRFWNTLLHDRATEIAETYNTNVPDLVDAWIAWVEIIQAERELVRQASRV